MSSQPPAPLRVAALLAALLSPACNPEIPTSTPDGAWRAFRKAVEQSDGPGAFSLLCDKDQSALRARAADASPNVKAEEMFNVDRRSLPPWRGMRVESQGDAAAVVTIVLDDGAQDRHEALLEGDHWRVVLGVSPP